MMAVTEIGGFRNFLPFLPFVKQAPDSAVWLTYDQDADVLYINFKKPSIATDSELTEDNVIVRYDDEDVVGFTVLHASKRAECNIIEGNGTQ